MDPIQCPGAHRRELASLTKLIHQEQLVVDGDRAMNKSICWSIVLDLVERSTVGDCIEGLVEIEY